ncbi:aminoacyl-tRNA hydrolase [Lacunimicrobium album]
MKVVVGLGNPESQYHGTRHNIGFDVIAELVRRTSATGPKSQFNAAIYETMIGNEKTLLVAPTTYMNLSGKCVQPLLAFYKLNPSLDLMVVCDDINLDVGRLRLRANGTDGGQKGLRSIIQMLGTNDYPRLRIGVGKPPGQQDLSSYVLGKFPDSELEIIKQSVERASTSIEFWVKEGLVSAMNRFNTLGSEA